MLEVKQITFAGRSSAVMSVPAAVEFVVARNACAAEHLERIQEEIDTLKQFVGAILERMPERNILNVLNEVSYGWEKDTAC